MSTLSDLIFLNKSVKRLFRISGKSFIDNVRRRLVVIQLKKIFGTIIMARGSINYDRKPKIRKNIE